jgi:hypothetical protein
MKAGLIALALAAVVLAATPQSSEARAYRHHYCTYFPHYDYTHSNQLSPMSYIYPVANWGPFFQCHMYVSPVVVVLPAPGLAPY